MNKNLLIVPLYNNASIIQDIISNLSAVENAQTLCIDDGSEDETFELMKEYKSCICIRHDQSLGYGAVVQTGLKYAKDMGYDVAVFCDIRRKKLIDDISVLLENINYGYDLVSSSRILENYSHETFESQLLDMTEEIAIRLRELTDYDVTDPLTETRAIKLSSIKDMELTDGSHGILLQLFVQAAYFGLDVLEIPSASNEEFGSELYLYEDVLGMLLSLMETESYLYKKGSIN